MSRIDGGGGSDEHLRWLLGRGYHVVAKGMNNRRAVALARQVRRWDSYGPNAWLGEVAPPVQYARPLRAFVKKRLKKDAFVHSYYVISLTLPSKSAFMTCCDNRGAAEVEQFRNDKSGLGLSARRKHSFAGRMATFCSPIWLTTYWLTSPPSIGRCPVAGYGSKRIVRDLLNTPGRLVFDDHRLARVELLSQKQFSRDLATCLRKYCSNA